MDTSRVLSRSTVIDLLKDVIENEQIVDPEIDISSGSNKGDGYLSFITKVDVRGKNKDLHVIMKCNPPLAVDGLIEIGATYDREILIYDEVIKLLQKFQEEYEVKEKFTEIAKCYKCVTTKGEQKLILENLKVAGFETCDRRKQMNEHHVKFVLEQYAKYHGLSYVFKDKRPEDYTKLASKMSNIWGESWSKPDMRMGLQLSMKYVMKVFESNEDSSVRDSVQKYAENCLDHFTDMKTNGKFTVISHGDCWCNNMMFKYQGENNHEKPSDMRLIDFQLSDDVSPAYDLAYFLYVSAPKSVLDNLDDFLKLYHDKMALFTKQFGTDLDKFLTFDELMEHWKFASKFGYNMFANIVKSLYQEESELVDMEDFASGKYTLEELNDRIMINEDIIRQRVREMTLHMYERGLFE